MGLLVIWAGAGAPVWGLGLHRYGGMSVMISSLTLPTATSWSTWVLLRDIALFIVQTSPSTMMDSPAAM